MRDGVPAAAELRSLEQAASASAAAAAASTRVHEARFTIQSLFRPDSRSGNGFHHLRRAAARRYQTNNTARRVTDVTFAAAPATLALKCSPDLTDQRFE
jgi:hypothetical protein